MNAHSINIDLVDEAATQRLGEDLALALKPGDMVRLSGDLGAGKSTLARALIQAAFDDDNIEVPSPTFTLVQSYSSNGPLGVISHFDLYRIEDAEEVEELGIFDALDNGIALIEWPERAAAHLQQPGLDIRLEHRQEYSRSATITGHKSVMERVGRSLAIRIFLTDNWQANVKRRYMLGDASTRAYETVSCRGEARILMNSPQMPDGPVIQDGKAYSQIAHLAENVRPFVAIAKILRQRGFETPEIYAQDLDQGFLLTSHLGSEGVVDADGHPVAEKYGAAVETLAAMHNFSWPAVVPMDDGVDHQIPPYDRIAMMIEVDLLTKWYVPRMAKIPLEDAAHGQYEQIWHRLIDLLEQSEKCLVLRDFHSPNILWLGQNSGIHRVGLIDFQDAVIGPCAYDLASLAQDARVDVPHTLEQKLVDTYVAVRTKNSSEFNKAEFRKFYAIMTAQRASKLLGLFVRLDERDHKPGYLAHLPRMQDYLQRSLEHPILGELKHWCKNVAGIV